MPASTLRVILADDERPARRFLADLLKTFPDVDDRYTITYRLHALEARLDPRRFLRLGRGTLAAVDSIQRVNPTSGGTYKVTLANGQQLPASRLQSRHLRETLLRF